MRLGTLRLTGPAETALWERIVARAFDANIETGPERHGSRALETCFEPGNSSLRARWPLSSSASTCRASGFPEL